MIPTFKNDDEAERYFGGQENYGSPDLTDDMTEEDDLPLIELEGEKYEVIDTVDVDGRKYIAILPYEEDDELSEDAEFTILEIIDDPADEVNCTLKTVDDEELYTRIGDAFMEKFGLEDD